MTGFSNFERRGLERTQTVTGSHPGADLLAAFSEHSLTSREEDQVLAHLAVCSTCREVVVIARSQLIEPVPEPLRKRGMWEMPLFHWGAATATAIIVVFAIAIGVREYQPAPRTAATATFNEVPPPAPATVPQTTSPAEPTAEQSGGLKANGSTAQAAQNTLASATTAAVRAKHLQEQVRYERLTEEVATPEAQAAVNKDVGVTAEVAPAGIPPSAKVAGRTISTTAAKASTPAPIGGLVAGRTSQVGVPSTLHWQIAKHGHLQRSTTPGTWTDVLTGHKIFAFTFGGTRIWAGSTKGQLYVSDDNGVTWKPISVHDGETGVNGNITQIDFSDAQIGTLSTSAAETWNTTDGGQTWHKQ